jgi:hypothetical protein
MVFVVGIVVDMVPRTGRPKSDNPHDAVVPVRFTAEQRDELKTWIEARGGTLSTFLREAGFAEKNRIEKAETRRKS